MSKTTTEEVEKELLSALSERAKNKEEILALMKKYRCLLFGPNYESPKPVGNDCSFCGKSEGDVNQLVAGPNVFICNECVELSHKLCNEKSTTTNI